MCVRNGFDLCIWFCSKNLCFLIFFVVKLFLYTVLFHNVTNTTSPNIVLRIICKTIFRYWGFDGKGSTAANTEKVLFNQTPFQSQLLFKTLFWWNVHERSLGFHLSGSFYFFRLTMERNWTILERSTRIKFWKADY